MENGIDTTLLRLSAIAGLICGGAIAMAGALETVIGQKVTLTQVLNGASVPFGLGLLVGLHLWQRAAAGRFGTVAFVLQFLGFGYFAGIAYTRNAVLVYLEQPSLDALLAGPSRLAFLGTALLALAGTVAFGVALSRAGAVPRPAVALYVLGLSALCLTFLLPTPIVRIGHVVGGAGMVWLALTLWRAVAPVATRKMDTCLDG